MLHSDAPPKLVLQVVDQVLEALEEGVGKERIGVLDGRHPVGVEVARDGNVEVLRADLEKASRDVEERLGATSEQVVTELRTRLEEAFGPEGHHVARRLWRTSRLLGRIDETLDARPKGRLGARALANLPVVGLAGGYLAERVALRRAAAEAAEILGQRQLSA